MGKEYPYARCDGQDPWSLKRPWEMVDQSQSGPTGQWHDEQHQDKRLCPPGSFGNTNIQMQIASTISPPPSNASWEPPGFVESSINFFGLLEISGLLWSSDGSGTSPLSLQLSPESVGGFFPPTNCILPASLGTVNSSKELGTFAGSPEPLEQLTDFLKIDSMSYPGSSMSDDQVHYPKDPQTSLTPLNAPAINFCGLPTPSIPWNQHSEFGNEIQLMPFSLSDIAPLSSPTGTSSWSQPNQLNTQIPWLQLCPTGVNSFDSFDIPKENVLRNQDCPLNSNLLQDATIRMDDRSTESETSRALLLQAQQLDSLDGDFTPSSISDKYSQMSYECSQNGVPENVTTTLADDSIYPPWAESLLSTQFEKSTLANGLAEDYSSFQPQVTPNQDALDNTQSKQSEETNEVGYDTCFGMVRSL
jgi:hypothetical protein